MLLVHAISGLLLLTLSLLILGLSLHKSRWHGVVALIGFASVLGAAVNGLQFVMSDFQNNDASFGMATSFIAAFVSEFVLAIMLQKSNRRTPDASSVLRF